jgi:hypothetical protein
MTLKKLVVAAAAAAVVSVPLAGAAWADPSTAPPPGPGGVPSEIGEIQGAPGPVPNGQLVSDNAQTKPAGPNRTAGLPPGQALVKVGTPVNPGFGHGNH